MKVAWTRRRFLKAMGVGGVLLISSLPLIQKLKTRKIQTEVFIGKVPDYSHNLVDVLRRGLRELGILPEEIRGKRILLKPNLVETYAGALHINTNPLVVRAAIEAFKGYGAAEIIVAEGPGHCRDSFLLLEESGLADVLVGEGIRFVDLNYDDVFSLPNPSWWSRLKTLVFPNTLKKVDWVVSMPKMKTHHWAGVTLSMKNMFGIMPGSYYGWPKNLLHYAGIHKTIVDINSAFVANLAILDGIVGMEGDGPIMGTPHPTGTLVIGRNLPAVDATSARIMGLTPQKVSHLVSSDGVIGTIREDNILQRGETIESVRTMFALDDNIPALKHLRL